MTRTSAVNDIDGVSQALGQTSFLLIGGVVGPRPQLKEKIPNTKWLKDREPVSVPTTLDNRLPVVEPTILGHCNAIWGEPERLQSHIRDHELG